MSGRLKINYVSDGLFVTLVFLCPPYFSSILQKGFGKIGAYILVGFSRTISWVNVLSYSYMLKNINKFVFFLQRKASKWMDGLKR